MADVKQQHDFSQGSVPGAIMRLALPMTTAQLFNILYSIADRIYMGHLPDNGQLVLTGVGVTLPIVSILNALASLCGVGGAPLASICRGKGDHDEAERIMGNSFVLLLIFGVAAMALVLAFKRPILYLFGASDATFPYADEYLTIYALGTVFLMIGLGMNPFINAQGFGRMGMLTVLSGAVVNAILDPILIFVLRMGATGAALSTVIAQVISAVWVLFFLGGRRATLRLRPRRMRIQAARTRSILALGLSGFFVGLTNSLTQVVSNATLQHYGGDLYVGVMTILNALREVITMPIQGMNNGTTPVLSFNFGAKLYSRVRHGIRFSIRLTVLYGALVWILIMLAPGLLIRMFTSDAATIAAGIPALRSYFCLFVFMSVQLSSQVVFVSLARAKNAIFFSLLRKVVIAAPLTVLLPLMFGTQGVFVAEAISQLVCGLICFSTMYLTVYRPFERLEDGV